MFTRLKHSGLCIMSVLDYMYTFSHTAKTCIRKKKDEATFIEEMDLWMISTYTCTTRKNIMIGGSVWWCKEHSLWSQTNQTLLVISIL